MDKSNKNNEKTIIQNLMLLYHILFLNVFANINDCFTATALNESYWSTSFVFLMIWAQRNFEDFMRVSNRNFGFKNFMIVFRQLSDYPKTTQWAHRQQKTCIAV